MSTTTTTIFTGRANPSNVYVGVRPTAIYKEPPFVKETGSICDPKIKTYQLQSEMLPKDRCHFFFAAMGLSVGTIVAKKLRCDQFNTKTELDKQFHLNYVVCNGFPFYWCSFPKEYEQTCEKIAKTYDFVINHKGHRITGIWGNDATVSYAAQLAEMCKKKIPADSKLREKPVLSKGPEKEKDIRGLVLHLPSSEHIIHIEHMSGETVSQESLKKLESSIV